MIDKQLILDYALAPGWMAPFVDGVQAGEAIAHQCKACEKVSFPPTRVCSCGHGHARWIKLAGTADIQFRTFGSDGEFALVQFHGAQTQTVMRLENVPNDQTTGRIMAPAGDLPQLILGAVSTKAQP